ncbi:MAG: glycerol-3-phosphate dehydrogenase/oxidase [Gemmatimonadales bacterium]
MRRDLGALSSATWDVAVVGGGIYGICAVYEAVRRGLSACLLERNDFVGATSSNSLKTIHGGLRYLQHADLGRMRESIRERARLLRVAPHLVRPLPFVLPTHGLGLHGKPIMRIALALNDAIGFDRSAGVLPGRSIPPGRVIGRSDVGRLVPGLDSGKLTGGAIWYDCQVANTERLALAYLRSAVAEGAACANYAEVTRLVVNDGRMRGVLAKDGMTGDTFEVQARTVLNASGPWIDRLLRGLPNGPPATRFHASKAFNLVTRRLYAGHAIGFTVPTAFSDSDALLNKGDRLFFVVPWREFSLIGTRHLPYRGGPDDFAVTEEDVDIFLAEINAACPGAGLTRSDVLAVLGGMLPEVPRNAAGEVQLVKHSQVYDHAADGAEGLVSVVGVKWTTARAAAEQALDAIQDRLGGSSLRRPPEVVLDGGDIENLDRFVSDGEAQRPPTVSPSTMRRVLENYGTTSRDVLAFVHREPALGRTLGSGAPVMAAEVRYGVEQEMALHLSDVVLRRTELGAGGHPGRETLAACAALMGPLLGWTGAQIQAEIDRTDSALRTTPQLHSFERNRS